MLTREMADNSVRLSFLKYNPQVQVWINRLRQAEIRVGLTRVWDQVVAELTLVHRFFIAPGKRNGTRRKLPRRNRLPAILETYRRRMEGASYKEIESETGANKDTIKSRLRTARMLAGDHHVFHMRDFNHMRECAQCRGLTYEGIGGYGEDRPKIHRRKKEMPMSSLKKEERARLGRFGYLAEEETD